MYKRQALYRPPCSGFYSRGGRLLTVPWVFYATEETDLYRPLCSFGLHCQGGTALYRPLCSVLYSRGGTVLSGLLCSVYIEGSMTFGGGNDVGYTPVVSGGFMLNSSTCGVEKNNSGTSTPAANYCIVTLRKLQLQPDE